MLAHGPLFVAFAPELGNNKFHIWSVRFEKAQTSNSSVSSSFHFSSSLPAGSFLVVGILGGSRKRSRQNLRGKSGVSRRRFILTRIYSMSESIFASEDLSEKLRRLGYHEVQSPPKERGEYRFQPSRGLLEIYLRDFSYPTEQFKGSPVRISLQGTIITKIENLHDRGGNGFPRARARADHRPL